MSAWRLLLDEPGDGAWNMAVDEAILDGYAAAQAYVPPTLRLYGWRPAALSLGRWQVATGAHDARFLREQGIDLVRRPTGGSAVLHDLEQTYAVVGRLREGPFEGGVLDTYRRIASAIALVLERLGVPADVRLPAPGGRLRAGPPSCFDETLAHEIAVGGRKLVGSAQLRRRGGFLQHGSILIGSAPQRLAGALGRPLRAGRFTDLRIAMGRDLEPGELEDALIAGFAEAFATGVEAGKLSEEERLAATRLRCWKYDSAAWTLEGRQGEPERYWGPLGPGSAV